MTAKAANGEIEESDRSVKKRPLLSPENEQDEEGAAAAIQSSSMKVLKSPPQSNIMRNRSFVIDDLEIDKDFSPSCIEPLIAPYKEGKDCQNEKQDETIKRYQESGDKKPSQNYLDDPVSYAIGEFGRWQFQLTFLLSLFNFPCTWHIFVLTFQGTPGGNFWCARPPNLAKAPPDVWMNFSGTTMVSSNGNVDYNPCEIKDLDYSNFVYYRNSNTIEGPFSSSSFASSRVCHDWEFEATDVGETIVSEWGLVCDKTQLRNVAEMMFLLGVAIGGFFSGLVSDRFGRKKTLMTSLVLQIVLGVSVAFAPHFKIFLILKTVLGFVCVSIVFSGFVLCMELVGGKWLTISGVSYLFPVPLSYMIIAGIAYVTHGWRYLQLAITLPATLFLALWWILPESPRWLLAMGRVDEVMEILKEASRVNKKPLPSNIDKILKQSVSVMNITDAPKGRVTDLFRTPTIRLISFVLYIVWFSVYLVYYGLVLNLSNIGGDVYINSVISGVVEFPAIAISIFILLKMGRRIPLCFTMILAGVACFLTMIVPISNDTNGHRWQWLTIGLAMIGKFSISSSNAVMPVFTAELFPTVIRNLGVGSSNVPAGIALMIVPYLWTLSDVTYHLPMALLGTVSILGGFSVLMLPETGDQGLTNTINNVEGGESRRNSKEKKKDEE